MARVAALAPRTIWPRRSLQELSVQRGRAVCEEVTGEADHALNCMMGPVRQAVHAELADILCDFIEEAGAKARREAFVHEFRPRRRQRNHAAASAEQSPEKEAFLDVAPCARSTTGEPVTSLRRLPSPSALLPAPPQESL